MGFIITSSALMIETNPSAVGEFKSEHEFIKSIAEEISQGILNLSAGENDVAVCSADIDKILSLSSADKELPASVSLLLFRKYAEIANFIKTEKENKKKESSFNLDPSSLILHEINEDKLNGLQAFGEKVFWLRALTSLFALISMAVMAVVPNTGKTFYPVSTFSDDCPYVQNNNAGSFNFQVYTSLVVYAPVLIGHNLFFAFYYMLPINDNKKKFIPGFCELPDFPNYIAPICDWILMLFALLVAILCSIQMNTVEGFTLHNKLSNKSELSYYSIGSFYAEFSNTDPPCVEKYEDPTNKLRISITLMYLTACLMGLCLAASFSHYRKMEWYEEGYEEGYNSKSSGNTAVNQLHNQRILSRETQMTGFSELPKVV